MKTAVVGHVSIDPAGGWKKRRSSSRRWSFQPSRRRRVCDRDWTHSDDGKGVGIVTFGSEQDAEGFAAQMQSMEMPPDSPVTPSSFEVYQIAATA